MDILIYVPHPFPLSLHHSRQAELSNPPTDAESEFSDGSEQDSASDDGNVSGPNADQDGATDRVQLTIDLNKFSRPCLEALATLSFLVERAPYPNPGLLASCTENDVDARLRLLLTGAGVNEGRVNSTPTPRPQPNG